jgi:threonine synthase
VDEEEIRAAVGELARIGLWMEPAGAAGLAGYRAALRDGLIDADGPTVVLLTASGFKWPRAMARVVDLERVGTQAELWQRLDRLAVARTRLNGPVGR